MVLTFSHELMQTGTPVPPSGATALLLGAVAWMLFASRAGLPVSTAHAFTGAVVGVGSEKVDAANASASPA